MITKEFEEAYKRLNKVQKEAVDTIEGPVMVIAGPGTGKTQILALRIANILLKTDTPPSGILALTFTEVGQRAMKMRLRELVGSRADEVSVFTYHGFASAVINEFADHFPHLARARQMSEVETETLIREILREKKFSKLRPLGDTEFYVDKIIKAISDCRKEAWTPEFVAKQAENKIEQISADPNSLSTRGASKGKLKAEVEKEIEKLERTKIFARVYAEYEANKREQKKYDFDDLIFEVLEALTKDDLLLRLLQEKYLYLLVDEHQDTNNAQNLLIKKLADFYDEPNLFIVGDEKQAIYRFQGASVQNFLAFEHAWPTMKIISLIDNYRSTQSILDAGFAMIENNYEVGEHEKLRIKLKSVGKENPEPVVVVMAGNNQSAEKYLIEEIKKIIFSNQNKTVAVIVRTNREVGRALEVLESAGVPASAERGANIFAHPVGLLTFNLWEFLVDESKIESLAYTLAGGLWDLNLNQSADWLKRLRSGQFIDWNKELPDLIRLKKLVTRTGAIEFLIETAKISGLIKLIANDPLSAEVWQTIITLAEDIAQAKKIEDPRALISELLAYRQLAETKNIKIVGGSVDASVLVMTAHGSKGLEYDYVFLPYATEEFWLPKGRGQYFALPESRIEGDEIRDARRLFYVALTRAKKQATIIVDLADTLGRSLTPLRFIDELDQTQIARVEIPKIERDVLSVVKARSPEARDRAESLEYAKYVLLEKGLSVTALNHFIDCPNKFFYKSILKLPEPPTPPAEKGNAMHEAIAAVWGLPKKNEKEIIKTLTEVVENYFRRSLLPVYEKEAVLEELAVAIPKVTKALLDHFNQTGTISAEKWEETNFGGQFDGQPINLRLHGKLDAIVEQTRKVLVFDYKTREAMSERAIKGETKNGDGNYFRQLVFYKLLLMENYLYTGKQIEPALVFIKPDRAGRCPIIALPIERGDIEKVKSEIQALIESVWSGQIFDTKCNDPKCEFCALRELMK